MPQHHDRLYRLQAKASTATKLVEAVVAELVAP